MQATRFGRHLNVTTEQLARPGGCCIRKLRGSAARRTRVANFSVTDVPVAAACEPNDKLHQLVTGAPFAGFPSSGYDELCFCMIFQHSTPSFP
jgi:hypothetical protein